MLEAFSIVGRIAVQGAQNAQQSIRDLGRQASGVNDRLGRLESGARGLSDRLQSMSSRFRGIASAGRRAAAGVAAVTGALGAVTAYASSTTEEINRFSRRLGVSTEYLSEMSYAAGQFGVDQEAMIDGMKELSLRTDEFAKTGKGPAVDAFTALGISAEEAGAMAGDTAKLFDTIRERISSVQNTAERQRLADELFGGSGGEQMIELLGLTRQQVGALRDEARQAGASVTDEQARISRAFTQSFNGLKATASSLVRIFGIELLPPLKSLFDSVKQSLIDNRDEIQAFGAQAADALRGAIPVVRRFFATLGDPDGVFQRTVGLVASVARGVGAVVGVFASLPSPVQKAVGVFTALVVAVGPILLIGGKIVGMFASMVGVLGSVIGGGTALSAAFLPLLAIFAKVAVALGVAYLAFKTIKAIIEGVVSAGTILINNWDRMVADVVAGAKSLGTRVVSAIGDMVTGVKDFFASLPSMAIGFINDMVSGVVSRVRNMVDNVIGAVSDMFMSLVGNSIFPDIADGATREMQRMNRNATAEAVGAAKGVTDALDSVPDAQFGAGVGAGAGAGGGPVTVDLRHSTFRDDKDMLDRLRRQGTDVTGAFG